MVTQQGDLHSELCSFKGLWKGGYCEGNPLDPWSASTYGPLGYVSMLYATYAACIKPYVTERTRVIEIGPGRGCWTKCMLNAAEIWCLDALPADHNGFYQYLNEPKNVKYFQVTDFKCEMLPPQHFDFLFSFGCFCHVSPAGFREYFASLFSKLKPGSHGFVMIGDYDKFNQASEQLRSSRCTFGLVGRRYLVPRLLLKAINRLPAKAYKDKAEDARPRPGRFYHLGVKAACEILEGNGYKIVDPDIGINHRDPIVHFLRP